MTVIHACVDDARVLVGYDSSISQALALDIAAGLAQFRDPVATPMVDKDLTTAHGTNDHDHEYVA
jgi:hypothetical protein